MSITTTTDPTTLFTLDEVADKLGISVRQLRRHIDSGEIPFIRIGERSIRISRQQLTDYIEKHTECHAAAK